jgi:hypothetical protein
MRSAPILSRTTRFDHFGKIILSSVHTLNYMAQQEIRKATKDTSAGNPLAAEGA